MSGRATCGRWHVGKALPIPCAWEMGTEWWTEQNVHVFRLAICNGRRFYASYCMIRERITVSLHIRGPSGITFWKTLHVPYPRERATMEYLPTSILCSISCQGIKYTHNNNNMCPYTYVATLEHACANTYSTVAGYHSKWLHHSPAHCKRCVKL